ncbi:hypothetical protein PJ985_09870 [Streptomyces sp. ACA25]|uniref:hypothetical protein n=1 Tax=Streptomyces sp. ACA25 TaxID=3022596 RepID=UPI0023077B50|nr:hypothetical protein [Streptomyces sp. ACA25]MDB1087871.1 hypothetical protein [Streptomyces sp. ACA25]
MRTFLKASALAGAAAMLIGASAATASAHDYKGKHSGDEVNVNVCGNTQQAAAAFSFVPVLGESEVEQGTANTVICQAGDANTAVIWAPSFELIGDIGLLDDGLL